MIEEIRAQIEKEMQATIGKLQGVIQDQNKEISQCAMQKLAFTKEL